MTDVTEFLLARIAEDEAAARAVAPPQMSGYRGDVPDRISVSRRRERSEDGYPFVVADPESTALLECFNPDRVLAECAAKRRIVTLYNLEYDNLENRWDEFYEGSTGALTDVLTYLLQPYANHPDFDHSWRL